MCGESVPSGATIANREDNMQTENKNDTAGGEILLFGNGEAPKKSRCRPKKRVKSISEVLCEVEKYNREHGTQLSYGKYLVLTGGK